MYITIKYILEAPKYFLTVCTVYNGRWPDIGGGFYFRNARTGEVHLDSILYPPPPAPLTCYETQLYDAFSLVVKLPAYEECGEGEED